MGNGVAYTEIEKYLTQVKVFAKAKTRVLHARYLRLAFGNKKVSFFGHRYLTHSICGMALSLTLSAQVYATEPSLPKDTISDISVLDTKQAVLPKKLSSEKRSSEKPSSEKPSSDKKASGEKVLGKPVGKTDLQSEKSEKGAQKQPASSQSPSIKSPSIKSLAAKGSDPESLEQATEKFKRILENAKLNGFVSDRTEKTPGLDTNDPDQRASDPQISVSQDTDSQNIQTVGPTALTCSDMDVLDMSQFFDIYDVEHLKQEKSKSDGSLDSQEIETLAQTYMSLGLGAEAYAVLKPYNTPRHVILSHVSTIMAGFNLNEHKVLFTDVAACGPTADLWAAFENPERLDYIAYTSGPQTLRYELKGYPKFLRIDLGLELAIKAAERGNLLLANGIWEDMVGKDATLKLGLRGDHSQLYLTALRSQERDVEKAIAIYEYLSERDGLFRSKALQALTTLKLNSGEALSENMEIDLASVSHEYSGEKAARDAAVQLIKNRIQAGMAIDAIRTTRKMLDPQDTEFLYAVDLIAVHIQGLFDSPDSTVNMLGLNSYLVDPDIFKHSNKQAALQRSALLAAIALDLPELGDVIYKSTQDVSGPDKAFLAYARALGRLKYDELPEAPTDLTSDVASRVSEENHANLLRREVIKTAFRLGDFKTAQMAIAKVPEPKEKAEFEQKLAWLQGNWDTVRLALAESAAGQSAEEKARSGLVDYISGAKALGVKNASSDENGTSPLPNLTNPIDVAAFVSDIAADLSSVQDYLDNG